MDENSKKTCPSCGEFNDGGSNFCGRCGKNLNAGPRKKVSIKWILLSMPVFFITQLALYIAIFFIRGPEFLLYPENLVIITYTGIPPVLFATAFLFAFLSRECSALDMAIATLLLSYLPIVLSGAWVFVKTGMVDFGGIYNLVIPLACGLISFAGSWTAKKLRARGAGVNP